MTKRMGSGRNARWGLLVSAVLMGLVLIGSTASNFLRTKQLSGAMARGNGELLLQGIRRGLRQAAVPPSRSDLAGVLEANADQGLRYLALVGPGGDFIAEAGVSVGGSVPLPPGPSDVLPLSGGIVRMRGQAPGLRPRRGRDADGRRRPEPLVHTGPGLAPDEDRDPRGRPAPPTDPGFGPPGDGDENPGEELGLSPDLEAGPGGVGGNPHRRLGPPPDLLIEFKPLLTEELSVQATQLLVIGLVSATVLMFAAGVFFRQSALADAAREGLERQRRLASLGEMSAVMAHELRNPLASLKGHAQLLEERLPSGSREREKAERVVREAVRLEVLASDLLEFVRSGQIQREKNSPAAMLRGAIESAGGERIVLQADQAPSEWSFDARRMHQVLTNLLENALHASPDGASVEAAVFCRGGRLLFSIRDFGQGIPEGQLEAIFEPFHTTRTRGVGLGLAVSRRIVELHGGTILASNHPEGGAVFEVSLPEA